MTSLDTAYIRRLLDTVQHIHSVDPLDEARVLEVSQLLSDLGNYSVIQNRTDSYEWNPDSDVITTDVRTLLKDWANWIDRILRSLPATPLTPITEKGIRRLRSITRLQVFPESFVISKNDIDESAMEKPNPELRPRLSPCQVYLSQLRVKGQGTVKVALKMVKHESVRDYESQRRMLLSELCVHGCCRHPHILSFRGIVAAEKYVRGEIFPFIIVTDWMNNGNVRQFLYGANYKGRVPDTNALAKATREIIRGLLFVHGVKLVHGDLKCPNILVDDAGSIRLADFGCTAVSESTQGPTTTANGAVSDHWIAPEIIGSHAGAEFTDRTYESDIYSLASTIWELFANQLPLEDPTNPGARVRTGLVAQGKLKPDSSVPSRLQHPQFQQLRGLLDRSWSLSPAERPNMEEFKRCVDEWV